MSFLFSYGLIQIIVFPPTVDYNHRLSVFSLVGVDSMNAWNAWGMSRVREHLTHIKP